MCEVPALTLSQEAYLLHVVLEVVADAGEEMVVGVQVRDDLVAVVEVVGAMVVHVVHGGLQEGGEEGRGGGKGGRRGVILIKTPYYSRWFSAKTVGINFDKK